MLDQIASWKKQKWQAIAHLNPQDAVEILDAERQYQPWAFSAARAYEAETAALCDCKIWKMVIGRYQNTSMCQCGTVLPTNNL